MGVFVLGGVILNCGGDGPTERTPTPSGEGYVWAAMSNAAAARWIMKVDVGTGEIHRIGVDGFDYGEWVVGIPVVEETGEFFLHKPYFFLARYDAEGDFVWREGETPYNWRDYSSIGYYADGNFIWGLEDKGWFEKRNGDDGSLISFKEIPELSGFRNPSIQVDQRDGSVWACSDDYLVKLSSGGVRLFSEQFNSARRTILKLALETATGNLWVMVEEKVPVEKFKLIKYSPTGTKLFTRDAFLQQRPTGMAVDPYTDELWLGYPNGVVVHKKNGEFGRSVPNFNYIRAFAFTDTKFIMGGGEEERSYCLYGTNKETGQELWSIKGQSWPITYVSYVEK